MKNITNINYDEAHKIVDNNKNLFWIGWDIVEYKKDPDSIYKKNAMYINNTWCSVNIYKPNNNGWRVPEKYVKR